MVIAGAFRMKAILFIYLITTFVHGQDNVHGQMFFLVLRPNFFPAIFAHHNNVWSSWIMSYLINAQGTRPYDKSIGRNKVLYGLLKW